MDEEPEQDPRVEFECDESVEKTLANPNHPIYKIMLALCGLLTILWTQNGSI